ncbi:MAG: putative peptide maturation dehydrogenase [Duganella sp.]
MKIRRCAVLYIQPREELDVDWASLFAGNSALVASTRWLALAPHLDREIDVDAADLAVLGSVSQNLWSARTDAERRHGAPVVARLLAAGLLLADADEGAEENADKADGDAAPPGLENGGAAPAGTADEQAASAGTTNGKSALAGTAGDKAALAALRARDETLRSHHWGPLAALAHTYSRWQGVRSDNGMDAPSFDELLARYGAPPPAVLQVAPAGAVCQLPPAPGGPLDEALLRRYTGRNYDLDASLPLAVAARLLQRTFGAQELRDVGPHANVLKKTSPSGGGLHPVEAFVLVQRIDGVTPGLYHYHPLDNTLIPLRTATREEAAALARVMVADQHWLSGAAMQVVMVGRVERSFWKYRNHQKAYRALSLDAGHLSQTFYLLAAEAGLPAFITAALNDVEIEQMLGLDHLRHAVIAVCGCGVAAAGPRTMVELRYGETGLG